MVQILPGFDQTVAPGLASVANAIQKIVQPYKDTEIELRGLIAKNPMIGQQLADMEYTSPGSTARIFGPNAGNYFASQQPSSKALISKQSRGTLETAMQNPENRQFVAQGEIGAQPSQITGERITNTQLQAMEAMLKAHPELQSDVTFQRALGMSRAKYENEQAELQATRGAETFLSERAKGMSPAEILSAIMGENPNFKVTTREVGDLFQSPTYGNLFKTLFAQKLEDQREALRLSIASRQSQRGLGEDIIRLKMGRALSRATEIENANPAAVAAHMYGINDPVVALLGGITDPKDARYPAFERQLAMAGEADRREGASKNVARLRAAQANVNAQRATLTKVIESGADDAAIDVQVSQLNQALEEASGITGHVVTAKFVLDPNRFFAGTPFDNIRSKGVYFFDEKGNPFNSEALEAVIQNGPLEKEKKEESEEKKINPVPGTASIGSGSSGSNNVSSALSTNSSSSSSITISARTIFPNAPDAMAAQLDRVATLINSSERQKYYDQILAQNPNLTDKQRSDLKTLFKLGN